MNQDEFTQVIAELAFQLSRKKLCTHEQFIEAFTAGKHYQQSHITAMIDETVKKMETGRANIELFAFPKK